MDEVSFSQNFIVKNNVVSKLISQCGFKSSDLVLDIGAGKGAISRELVKYANRVIAVEIDRELTDILKKQDILNLKVLNLDFLQYEFPPEYFKVFSNIPFNKTADILKKLLSTKYFTQGYLMLQKEAAGKFAGEQVLQKNTLLSIIYGIDYVFSIEYRFKPMDFRPIPNVNIVLLKIERREKSLVNDRQMFRDFVAYMFGNKGGIDKIFSKIQLKRLEKEGTLPKNFIPSDMKLSQFISLFKLFSMNEENRKRVVFGEYGRMKWYEGKIEKVHRTR